MVSWGFIVWAFHSSDLNMCPFEFVNKVFRLITKEIGIQLTLMIKLQHIKRHTYKYQYE